MGCNGSSRTTWRMGTPKHKFILSKALAAKSSWRLITSKNLLTRVVYHKYILLEYIEEWIQNPTKRISNCTIIWKALIHSFSLIGEGLAWRRGKGKIFIIGADPWPRNGIIHIIHNDLVLHLNENGFKSLTRCAHLFGLKSRNLVTRLD
jgi:hypothetical protein